MIMPLMSVIIMLRPIRELRYSEISCAYLSSIFVTSFIETAYLISYLVIISQSADYFKKMMSGKMSDLKSYIRRMREY